MSKRLVAYFSASGVTAKVAENLADAIGADIFEIQPEVPYTKADLNWMDKKARTTIEMSDPTLQHIAFHSHSKSQLLNGAILWTILLQFFSFHQNESVFQVTHPN